MQLNTHLIKVLTTPTDEIFDYLEQYLIEDRGYVTYAHSEESYLVMGPADISQVGVALVAHVDTVGDVNHKLPTVYSNITDPDYLASAGTCCLDDRNGVALITSRMGTDAMLIFLKGEEVGCMGAIALSEDYPELEMIFGPDNALQCLIEVDRKGINEVVFYDLDYPEFENLFLTKYEKNISHAWTDITVLGPMWNIAAANVSAGYYKEHTDYEHTSLEDLETAFIKLRHMVFRFNGRVSRNFPPFEYRGKSSTCCMLLMSYSYEEPEVFEPLPFDETVPLPAGLP